MEKICVHNFVFVVLMALLAGFSSFGAEPGLGELGLKDLPIPKEALTFIDGVRCGDPADPHKVIDYDKPSQVGPVLNHPARLAAGPWSVFGYTLTVQHPDQPHLLILTYPDDLARRVHFRVSGGKGGYPPLRSAVNTIYSAYYHVNTKNWTKLWTPLYIPGGTGNQVTVMFADSRSSRSPAPNDELKQAEPWAVGEILLYEITQPEKLLLPLAMARPVQPGQERYFGLAQLGYAENYFRNPAPRNYLKKYLAHIGVNFLLVAGGQGGPPFGRPEFEAQLSVLDAMGVQTSFSLFKYFNAFLRDRLKTRTLPQELIETMPKPVKEAIDSLDGWRKPENLYEGGSYSAKLMVMQLDWLDPEMGPWLEKLVAHYLKPAAQHKCIRMVRFFGGARAAGQLPAAMEKFTRVVKEVRDDLMVEVPMLYMHLRARELAKQPVPYSLDFEHPFATTNEQGKYQVHDQLRIYANWPPHMKGVIGGLSGSLWRGFHLPPPGLAILESKPARASVQRFADGWMAQFRICEQNESESPKGIGWINDYYPWSGLAFRVNLLKMMAANPRYLILDLGHEGTAGQEFQLRHLAAAWRAFPWGPAEDLSRELTPPGSQVTALRCQGRLLLLNQEPASRTVKLPAASGLLLDAVTGEALRNESLSLGPFEARTLAPAKEANP